MSNLSKIAEDFGRFVFPIVERINVQDVMLFGGVAKGDKNARDIDILIIHKNPKLDRFSKLLKKRKFFSTIEAILYLGREFPEIRLKENLNNEPISTLVKKKLLDTSYMNLSYFSNPEYMSLWDSLNRDPNFARNIFSYGKLYNPLTGKYDTPALSKYQLPERKIKQLENQPSP
ncbi:MAG: nucleotidyltransferase domain-containing protein [Nanoarchaeota archaeon]|nr:nucleotidyltransferase domain-containing protein [Nanoarchaeota archaeon]